MVCTNVRLADFAGLLELLFTALLARVGSPLSLQALREELQVSHDSVGRWLTIFDNLYLRFRLPPFGAPKVRAVKKEHKPYLWDCSVLKEAGPRFENLVAAQLMPPCGVRQRIADSG